MRRSRQGIYMVGSSMTRSTMQGDVRLGIFGVGLSCSCGTDERALLGSRAAAVSDPLIQLTADNGKGAREFSSVFLHCLCIDGQKLVGISINVVEQCGRRDSVRSLPGSSKVVRVGH